MYTKSYKAQPKKTQSVNHVGNIGISAFVISLILVGLVSWAIVRTFNLDNGSTSCSNSSGAEYEYSMPYSLGEKGSFLYVGENGELMWNSGSYIVDIFGDTMHSNLFMDSNYIKDISDPMDTQDAATKAYVDSSSFGVTVFRNIGSSETLLVSDQYIGAVGGIILTLPPISGFVGNVHVYHIIDSTGLVSSGNSIQITPNAVDTIQGSSGPLIINTPRQSVSIVSNGTSDWLVF